MSDVLKRLAPTGVLVASCAGAYVLFRQQRAQQEEQGKRVRPYSFGELFPHNKVVLGWALVFGSLTVVGFNVIGQEEYLGHAAKVYGYFLPPVFGGSSPVYEHIREQKDALLQYHAVVTLFPMTVGLTQFSDRLRQELPTVHRWVGRLSVGATLSSLLAMVYRSHFVDVYGGFKVALAFDLMALGIVLPMAKGWLEARKKNFRAHRRWMRRGFWNLYCSAFCARMLMLGYIPMQVKAAGMEEAYPGQPKLAYEAAWTAAVVASSVLPTMAIELVGAFDDDN